MSAAFTKAARKYLLCCTERIDTLRIDTHNPLHNGVVKHIISTSYHLELYEKYKISSALKSIDKNHENHKRSKESLRSLRPSPTPVPGVSKLFFFQRIICPEFEKNRLPTNYVSGASKVLFSNESIICPGFQKYWFSNEVQSGGSKVFTNSSPGQKSSFSKELPVCGFKNMICLMNYLFLADKI